MNFAIRPPEIRGNRLRVSWDPPGPLEPGFYEVEYPDVRQIDASAGKLAETLYPLCLAMAAVGATRITLPARIDPDILENWRAGLRLAARAVFRRRSACAIENGSAPPDYREPSEDRTALFLGGGTESLLTLALLRERGIAPILLILGGPSWRGSDPEKNPDKFALDEALSRDLGLERFRAFTDFVRIVGSVEWRRHLRPGHWPLSSFLFTPLFISLALPLCESLGIRTLLMGHEKMKEAWEFFSFSPPMTSALSHPAHGLQYRVEVQDRLKQEICHELYSRYPDLARYQSSCWKNERERWCHACESCLRSYLFLTIEGMAAESIGLDAGRLMRNRRAAVSDTLRSPDCYADEYWGYLWGHSALRKNPHLRGLLDEIRLKSFFFKRPHDLYMRLPFALRRLKTRLTSPMQ